MKVFKTSMESSLASQIHEATSQNLELVAIDQPEVVSQCDGPENIVHYFIEALCSYPPTVFRLPFALVLIEVLGLTNETGSRKRKTRKTMRSLGKVVRKAVGTGDLVVRCGSNQFSLLLLGHDEVSAGKVCERIKNAIHHYMYIVLKRKESLELEFAIAQHVPGGGDDIAELVFSNQQVIRLARALGDGAIVSRSEVKDRFQSHSSHAYRLGESFDQTILQIDGR